MKGAQEAPARPFTRKQRLPSILEKLERATDSVRLSLKRRRGYTNPIAIQPFRGYGTTRHVRLVARVLEDRGLPAPMPQDSAWVNLRRMLRTGETAFSDLLGENDG